MADRHWGAARLALIVALLLAALGGTALSRPAVAQVVPLGEASPAEAVVIAQGVTTLADGEVGWRVVRAEAGSRDDQQPADAATGFVVAGSERVLVSDLDTSAQVLLAAGEATWVAGGTSQQRASLSDSPVTYSEISIVPASDVDDGGDGDVLYGGDPFDAPGDPRRLELAAVTLAGGQELDVTAGEGEALVFVGGGTVAVSTGGDLGGGDAQGYDEDVTLTNSGDDPARVYVARIGDAVPPLPAFTGSATLEVRACPEGSSAASFQPDTCQPVDASDGFGVSLLDASYQPVETDDPFEDGERTWDDLEYGVYPWGAPTLPAPYVGTLWTDTDNNLLDIAQVIVDEDTLDTTHVLYVFPVTAGTISVTVANCPAGVTLDTLIDAVCDAPGASASRVVLTTPDGETLDAGDGTVSGSTVTFAVDVDNDAGDVFTVDQTGLPAGYDDYLVTAGGPGEVNGPLALSLTSTNPAISVTILNLTDEPASASPSPSAGSGAGTGSITLQVLGCPPGVQRGQSDQYGSCTQLVGGASVSLITPSGTSLSAVATGGVTSFTGLGYGTYALGLTGLPAGYFGAVAPGYSESAAGSGAVTVSVSADNPSPVVTVLIFQ